MKCNMGDTALLAWDHLQNPTIQSIGGWTAEMAASHRLLTGVGKTMPGATKISTVREATLTNANGTKGTGWRTNLGTVEWQEEEEEVLVLVLEDSTHHLRIIHPLINNSSSHRSTITTHTTNNTSNHSNITISSRCLSSTIRVITTAGIRMNTEEEVVEVMDVVGEGVVVVEEVAEVEATITIEYPHFL